MFTTFVLKIEPTLSLKNKNAIFFKVGAIGYIVGFLAWLTWFFLVILNLFIYWLGYGYPNIMSGIFFQHGPYLLIVYGFFSMSSLLGSFACFGLKRSYGSNIALVCGLFYLAIFVILCYSVVEVYFFRNYVPIVANTLMFLNLGLLFWGVTLLEVRKFLPHPRLSFWIGCIFIAIAIPTLTLFWQAIMYWGIELWLMLLGWLYAINAVATAILLYRLSRQSV